MGDASLDGMHTLKGDALMLPANGHGYRATPIIMSTR